MKILHLIQRYEPAVGGSETWCRELARRQVRAGHHVRVLTLDVVRETEFWAEPVAEGARLRLGRLDLDDGVEVRRCRRSLPVWTLHHVILRFLLGRILNIFLLGPHSWEMLTHLDVEVHWADLVHLHALPYPHNIFGLRAARRVGRSVVCTPHFHVGHPDYERPHFFRLLRRVDRVAAISQHEKAALVRRGVPEKNVTVTGCGVTTSAAPFTRSESRAWLLRRLGLSSPVAIVACVARKTREKGLEALMEAVGVLRASGRDVVLVLAGPPVEAFGSLAAHLTGAARSGVFDLGAVTETERSRLLAGADLFAMPSRYEAFGIVFLEAWLAGLPVIGGDAGAQPEVIGDGGRTVPFGDVGAIADAIAFYLDRPEEARRAVEWGRQALNLRHDWDQIVESVERCYRAAINETLDGS